MRTQNQSERHTSYRQETGQYVPRQFNDKSRERFLRERRQTYLKRIDGTPSDAQLAMIQSMARLEWFALAAEQGEDLVSMRESREHRRLLLRTVADFEATLQPPTRQVGKRLAGLHDRFGSPPR